VPKLGLLKEVEEDHFNFVEAIMLTDGGIHLLKIFPS